MPPEQATELQEQEIRESAANYVECLNLTPGTNVLIVTDVIPVDQSPISDVNVAIRRQITDYIAEQLIHDRYNVGVVRFDNSTPKDRMKEETLRELQTLHAKAKEANPTVVIYMGDVWKNRSGMYEGASDFGKDHEVKMAGSLGFSTGDCRVMGKMNSLQRERLIGVDKQFKEFFQAHPRGRFLVLTRRDLYVFPLVVDYDVTKSPFIPDVGRFHPEYDEKSDDYNYVYINIPGGERYGTPYPFRGSSGYFAASGIVFEVKKGMVVGLEAPQSVLDKITEPSQRLAIELIRSGRHLPFAELGLGFYFTLGIPTFTDSSVLSGEKRGPHGGIGHSPGKTIEGKAITDEAGDFHHTDFVMDEPSILFIDLGNGSIIPFYPFVQ